MSRVTLRGLSGLARSMLAIGALAVAAAPQMSSASILTPFTGDAASVEVSISQLDAKRVAFDVTVVIDPNIADLRGVFLHIANEALVPDLDVFGLDVTDSDFDANSVINLGGGANLNGGATPCGCDIGIEIGTSGIGTDDIQTTRFELFLMSGADLLASEFEGQDIGVRVTSVGLPGGTRNGSSKLSGTIIPPDGGGPGGIAEVPAPGMLALLGLGLLGMAWRCRRRSH